MKAALLAATLFASALACPAAAVEVRRIAPESSVSSDDCGKRNCREVRRIRRADCHRDVRTHRIGGVRVRHRHVGDDCAVRVVRRGESAGRP